MCRSVRATRPHRSLLSYLEAFRMKNALGLGLLSLGLAAGPPAFAKRPITFEDLMKVQRISDPQVSPDGRWIAYVQVTADLEANKKTGHISLVPADGVGARQL